MAYFNIKNLKSNNLSLCKKQKIKIKDFKQKNFKIQIKIPKKSNIKNKLKVKEEIEKEI